MQLTFGILLAAKFVREAPDKLEISSKNIATADPDIRITFPMAMGVRHGDTARLEELNTIISNNEPQIRTIIESYWVPLAEGSQCTPLKHEASLPADNESASVTTPDLLVMPASAETSSNIVKVAATDPAGGEINCERSRKPWKISKK